MFCHIFLSDTDAAADHPGERLFSSAQERRAAEGLPRVFGGEEDPRSKSRKKGEDDRPPKREKKIVKNTNWVVSAVEELARNS